jgi:hypothetical protein
MLSRRQIVLFGCLIVLPFLLWSFVTLNEEYSLSGTALSASICSAILPSKQEKLVVPQKRHRVAVASTFGFHFDVYMALVWTLQRVMDRSQTGSVEIYTPAPFNFEFQTIVDNLQLYRGETKTSDELIEAINSNMGDGGIDMVVLGTCEFECVFFSFWRKLPLSSPYSLRGGPWPEELLAAWDARDDAHKFKLVCIVHNVQVSIRWIFSSRH